MDKFFKIATSFLLVVIITMLVFCLIRLETLWQSMQQLSPSQTPLETAQGSPALISPPSAANDALDSTPDSTATTQGPDTEMFMADTPLLRFVVCADSRGLYHDEIDTFEGELGGVNTVVVDRVMQSVSRLDPAPSFMVTLGDYGMGSSNETEARAQYEQWLQAVTPYYPESFFYTLYGNHEAKLAGKEGILVFSDVFDAFEADEFFEAGIYGRTVYHLSKNNINFFMLNTNSPNQPHRVSNAVIEWMQSKINLGERNNFFFIHEPAFPSGNHVGRSLDVDTVQRDAFWTFVSNAPGAIVFNAHEHQYVRRLVDNTFHASFRNSVYQITTAGMGAPFHYTLTDERGMIAPPQYVYHYVVCDVYPDRIQIFAEDLDGNLLDDFMLMPAL